MSNIDSSLAMRFSSLGECRKKGECENLNAKMSKHKKYDYNAGQHTLPAAETAATPAQVVASRLPLDNATPFRMASPCGLRHKRQNASFRSTGEPDGFQNEDGPTALCLQKESWVDLSERNSAVAEFRRSARRLRRQQITHAVYSPQHRYPDPRNVPMCGQLMMPHVPLLSAQSGRSRDNPLVLVKRINIYPWPGC